MSVIRSKCLKKRRERERERERERVCNTCINQIQMSPTEGETDKTKCETKTLNIRLIY